MNKVDAETKAEGQKRSPLLSLYSDEKCLKEGDKEVEIYGESYTELIESCKN